MYQLVSRYVKDLPCIFLRRTAIVFHEKHRGPRQKLLNQTHPTRDILKCATKNTNYMKPALVRMNSSDYFPGSLLVWCSAAMSPRTASFMFILSRP